MSVSLAEFHQIATKADLNDLENRFGGQLGRLVEMISKLSDTFDLKIQALDGKGKQEFLSATQFARIMGLGRNTVIRRCQEGLYRCSQPGGKGTRILIPVEEVERVRRESI